MKVKVYRWDEKAERFRTTGYSKQTTFCARENHRTCYHSQQFDVAFRDHEIVQVCTYGDYISIYTQPREEEKK